jgi:hypothetical protein
VIFRHGAAGEVGMMRVLEEETVVTVRQAAALVVSAFIWIEACVCRFAESTP